MMDSARDARLLELATQAAKLAHYANIDGWGNSLGAGHSREFETCQSADCRLVREAATPTEPKRQLCVCKVPDPVMQADMRFHCYTCSFQVPAVLCEDCQRIQVFAALPPAEEPQP